MVGRVFAGRGVTPRRAFAAAVVAANRDWTSPRRPRRPLRSDRPTRPRGRLPSYRTGPNRPPARCRRSSPTARRPTRDLDAWSAAASTPRFRAEGSDWADADYPRDALTDDSDDTVNVGAADAGALDDGIVDEDEAFAAELAERRRRTPRGRASRTMVTSAGAGTATEGSSAPAAKSSGLGGPARRSTDAAATSRRPARRARCAVVISRPRSPRPRSSRWSRSSASPKARSGPRCSPP